MEKKTKRYLKLNLMSILFIAVSLMSVTLAWFAYSGLVKVNTEVSVKAWYIELDKDGSKVANNMIISFSDIYPGMTPVTETVTIKNKGDSNASVSYAIESARILDDPADNYIVNETVTAPYVEDVLSHNYPFKINMVLSHNYAEAITGESSYTISISWPLDSNDNEADSTWGSKAYLFQQSEAEKKVLDPEYQPQSSIQVAISLTAEQYIEEDTASDPMYSLGTSILYDVVNKLPCSEIGSTCLETKVIDINNKLGDSTVTLLPNPNTLYQNSTIDNYGTTMTNITTGWTVDTRPLIAEDIIKALSLDITSSYISIPNLSDAIIGDTKYENRATSIINSVSTNLGYMKFLKDKYSYFNTNNCYWTNTSYDSNKYYAVSSLDDTNYKLYGEQKTTSCNVVPVILINKN